MRTARVWFYLLAASQALFLTTWAGRHEWILRESPSVLLEVRPVDPDEILRGTYILLNYSISTIPDSLLTAPPGPNDSEPGGRICVVLAPQGEFWQAASATLGRCPSGGRDRVEGRLDYLDGTENVRVDYGIGRYYVPEGMGNPRGRLSARVAITPDGRPFLKQVYEEGRPYP